MQTAEHLDCPQQKRPAAHLDRAFQKQPAAHLNRLAQLQPAARRGPFHKHGATNCMKRPTVMTYKLQILCTSESKSESWCVESVYGWPPKAEKMLLEPLLKNVPPRPRGQKVIGAWQFQKL